MKASKKSRILILSSVVVLSLIISMGCKKTNNSPSFYFTAEVNGKKANFAYQLFATRNSIYGSPDSNLLFSGTDTAQKRSISIRLNSYPSSLSTGVFKNIGEYGYCLFDDDGIGYTTDGMTIIINEIDSSIVQGSLNGELTAFLAPTLTLTASFSIRISN
jgi:hypothetical protein